MDHAKQWNARITFKLRATAQTIGRNLKAFFTLKGYLGTEDLKKRFKESVPNQDIARMDTYSVWGIHVGLRVVRECSLIHQSALICRKAFEGNGTFGFDISATVLPFSRTGVPCWQDRLRDFKISGYTFLRVAASPTTSEPKDSHRKGLGPETVSVSNKHPGFTKAPMLDQRHMGFRFSFYAIQHRVEIGRVHSPFPANSLLSDSRHGGEIVRSGSLICWRWECGFVEHPRI